MKQITGYPEALGVTIREGVVNFAIQVPSNQPCELLLYKKGEASPAWSFPMSKDLAIGEVRFIALADFEIDDYEYTYKIGSKEVIDVYAKELSPRLQLGDEMSVEKGLRARIPSREFDWAGDKQLGIPQEEVIAYSLHMRGFTKHSSSKVKEKGQFSGLLEKIPYLKDLGINQIHCMPLYEFIEKEGEKINYWGYGKGYYFAPKATYSQNKSPVRELKILVQALHKAGIELILEMPFVSGVLPQTALACLHYYMLEYHIDGFILNPAHLPFAMFTQDPLLKGVKLLQKDEEKQNALRRFLKGDEAMVEHMMQTLAFHDRDAGHYLYVTNQTGFTLRDLYSYDGKHNELNGEQNQDGPKYNYSWNCGAEGPSRRKDIKELRRQQVLNAYFLLLTAQGTPCLLAGDEFYNTQKGNNNVYCQDNDLAWLNWTPLTKDATLFDFLKGLISLRKSLSVLRQPSKLKGLDYTSSGFPDVSFHGKNAWQVPLEVASRQLGILYYDKDRPCFIAYNMHWLDHEFALPTLPGKKKYYMLADTKGGISSKPVQLEDQKHMVLKARTVVLLVGK